VCVWLCGCAQVTAPTSSPAQGPTAVAASFPEAAPIVSVDAGAAEDDANRDGHQRPGDGAAEAGEDAVTYDDDPMALHYADPTALRALMGKAASLPFPLGGPWRIGQGNRAISQHAIGRRACLDGLRDVTLQSPEQRDRCDADSMVPVWGKGGSASTARFCIDVFEFPNRPCELPFVFVTPPQALAICQAEGKRLCTQDEWNLACRADPAGGPDRTYAYGEELDLTICNTNKSRAHGPFCDVSTTEKVWKTCGTDTEPAGAFPRCRSRFGVFDQHGNVAEIMTRTERADGTVKSQLKGSAFFYVDVAKKPTDPGGYWTKYPDDCNFDPRWHVENVATAQHSNYHLGFRCCKSVPEADAGRPPDSSRQ